MTNYIIEGNINFYEELFKSYDTNEIEEVENCCLITNEALTENFVKLECGHTFNYNAIFNDIVNHKLKYNSMERKMIKSNEIRCPYCRHIQTKLLPYIDGMEKINGVNYFNTTINEYNNIFQIGEHCGTENCTSKYVKLLPCMGKSYCFKHYYIEQKLYFNTQKIKEKQDKENLKKKEEEIKQNKKNEEKLKKEEEKLKQKIEKLKKEEEKLKKEAEKLKQKVEKMQKTAEKVKKDELQINVILVEGCSQLLKTGLKKGQQCCLKIHQDNFCLRHSNLNKIIKI